MGCVGRIGSGGAVSIADGRWRRGTQHMRRFFGDDNSEVAENWEAFGEGFHMSRV